MRRAIHQGTTTGRILLEGIADGRPIVEKAYLTKQPVYVDRYHTFDRYRYTDFLASWFSLFTPVVTRSLTLADFGYDMHTSVEVAGFSDFHIANFAPLPAKIQDLVTNGDLVASSFDSILLIDPSHGLLSGGPNVSTGQIVYGGDLVISGSNLTEIPPVTSEIQIVKPAILIGTDIATPKVFGAGMRYIYLRNDADQEWLRIPFTGNMDETQCAVAINNKVAMCIQNGYTLGGRRAPYFPNIFANPTGTNTINIFAIGRSGADVPRIEIASAAFVTAQGDSPANQILLGAGFVAGASNTAAIRGTVLHADIVHGGTTLTVAAGDLPAGVAVGDLAYVSINEVDDIATIIP